MPLSLTPTTSGRLILVPTSLTDVLFSVMDYGAIGNGVTNDSAAMQACYDAIPSQGGIMFFPAGSYVGGFQMNDPKTVVVSGYGATLLPASSQIAIDITMGNGIVGGKAAPVIEGLLIDGLGGVGYPAGHTSVTGIKVTNTDWVRMRNVKVQNCTTGLHFLASSTGFCESASIELTVFYGCTTGIRFQNTGSSGSFAQTALRDVGCNDCTTAIDATGNNGTGLQRTSFENVMIWLARAAQTGVSIGCNVAGADWKIAFESNGIATTGFNVTTNTTGVDTCKLQVDWASVDASCTRATVGAGLRWTWREGADYVVTKLGAGTAEPPLLRVRSQGDTVDRFGIQGGAHPGILAGLGSSTLVAMYLNNSRWQIDQQLLVGDGVIGKYLVSAGKTTVVDGDFTLTPTDGAIAVHYDTTAGKAYVSVRANGSWVVMAGPKP